MSMALNNMCSKEWQMYIFSLSLFTSSAFSYWISNMHLKCVIFKTKLTPQCAPPEFSISGNGNFILPVTQSKGCGVIIDSFSSHSTFNKSCCLFLRGMDCYSRTQSEIQSLFCPLRGPHELDPSLPWLYFLPVSPSPSLFEPLVFWLFYKHAMFSPQGLKDYSSSYLETFPSWNPHN